MVEMLPEFKFGVKLATPYLLAAAELILALLSGLGLTALGVGGGAWILGGIIGGAIAFYLYRSLLSSQAQPNRNSRRIGQILVGLAIGFSIQHSNLFALSLQLPVFLLMTLFLVFSGGIIGYFYSRIEKTDLLTALLATVPGNIGVMASLAADYGRNTSLVSLVQLIRFTSIILFVPIIANVANSRDITPIFSSVTRDLLKFDLTYLFLLTLLLIVTASAVHLGRKLKFPVAAFFCSILVGLLFNSLLAFLTFIPHVDFSLPLLVNLVGQALLGITIGEYWAINPRLEKRTVAYTAIPVTLTFLAGFLSGGIATLLTPWDWLTCLLVASPGGSPEMILIALTLHHNVEVVAASHLVRLTIINLTLPALISLVCYLENRANKLISS